MPFSASSKTPIHTRCAGKTEHGLQVQKLHLDRSKAVRVNSAHGRLRLFKVNSANFTEIAVWLTKSKVQVLAQESQAQNASTPRNRSGRNVFSPENSTPSRPVLLRAHSAVAQRSGRSLQLLSILCPRPNPSLNRTPHGVPAWPGCRYTVHGRHPGQAGPPRCAG